MRESDELIYRYLDRELDAEGCAQLSEWLAKDPSHTRRFAVLASEQYQVRELTRQVFFPPTAQTQADLMRSLLSMEEGAQAQTVTWHEPKPKPKRPARSAFQPPAAQHAAPSRVIVISPWVVAGSLVAAAVVVLMVLFKPAQPSPSTPPPPPQVAAAQAPAVVESSQGVVLSAQTPWEGGRGDRLPAGRIELTRGEVTLRFDGGARVVLTAPCVFTVEDARSMRLEAGRAVVESSPWEDGFAVNTAHQRFVDKDTTFGVDAFADGVQLQVFSGSVDLYRPLGGGTGGELVAQAGALQAYHTSAGQTPRPVAFEVDRYRTGTSASMLPTITRRTVVFREGERGYCGTTDTWFSGRSNPLESDGFADGTYLRIGRWDAANQQALIRFDAIFGPGAAQIPDDAQIESASLVLYNANDIRDSFGSVSPMGDAFAVYRVLTRWDETDAYAGRPWVAGATPQVDTDGREADAAASGDCAAQLVASAGHIIPPDTRITVDVTGPVAAWAKGGANHGLLLQSLGPHASSPRAADEGDALFVASSEYATNPSRRPALEVTYLVAEPANR